MKRFYQEVTLHSTQEGYHITLDSTPLKTPQARILRLPHKAWAEAIGEEWKNQGERLHLTQMPLTQLAFTIIDHILPKVEVQEAIRGELLRYAASDLLCYRASYPESLRQQQQAVWDPILKWMADHYGALFQVGEGVIFIEQPREALQKIEMALQALMSPFTLAVVERMTRTLGSLFLALAVLEGHITIEYAFRAAHIDEIYQMHLWGEDEEAHARHRLQAEVLKSLEPVVLLKSH